MLFIRNDHCCSKKIQFSCSRNEQNCATFPLLREQAGVGGLQQKAKLLPSSHCELSCSLTDPVMGAAAWIREFNMRGGVSASFALLKVFVSKLDPAGGRICEFPCLIFVVVWKDSALLLGHCKVALFFCLFVFSFVKNLFFSWATEIQKGEEEITFFPSDFIRTI